MKYIFALYLLFRLCPSAFSQGNDTLHVFFPLNKANITETGTKFLDSLISSKIIEPGKPLILLGYGDYLGNVDYNKGLSYNRAKNIQDYLTVSGFYARDITLCIGKGKINRPEVNGKLGNPIDRRVDLIFAKPIDTPEADKFRYYMHRLNVTETMILKGIHFFRGSLRLTPASLPSVQLLVDFLNENSTYQIQLEGHICCIYPSMGTDEPYDESTLSTKRAQSIYDSLIKHGIDKERLRFVGLGNTNPIYLPEETEEQQEMNRRVEVRILSK